MQLFGSVSTFLRLLGWLKDECLVAVRTSKSHEILRRWSDRVFHDILIDNSYSVGLRGISVQRWLSKLAIVVFGIESKKIL